MNVAVQLERKPPAWWKAISQAVGVLYAPFVLMASYTVVSVSCSHCKKAVWEILPLAPGLMPSWFLLPRFSNHLPNAVLWLSCGAFDLLVVAGLALMIRRGGRWKWVGMIGTLVLASVLAVLTLMLIRA